VPIVTAVEPTVTWPAVPSKKALLLACLGNPDPGDMKVYCPTGKETFDDDETTEEAPS
jgi:hypothetical protein